MNIKKISLILVIFLLVVNTILVPKSNATTMGKIIQDGDDFLSGDNTNSVVNEAMLKQTSKVIYNIFLIIGVSVAVIVGAVLGLTFIFGSAEGKAKVSEALIPYIVGCIVVFAAFTIWGIVVNMGNQAFTI